MPGGERDHVPEVKDFKRRGACLVRVWLSCVVKKALGAVWVWLGAARTEKGKGRRRGICARTARGLWGA
jgi:hypothetical protein